MKVLYERFQWYEIVTLKRSIIVYKVKVQQNTKKMQKENGGFTVLIGCLDSSIRVGVALVEATSPPLACVFIVQF